MNNHVISLTTASQRREHINHEFGKHCIDFEFFDAVTPSSLKDTAQRLDIDLNSKHQLSEYELSCLCSHVCLWKKAIDDDMPHIAIFEDDVYLSRDAHSFLTDTTWIPKDSGLIKIEKTAKKALLKNPITLKHGHQLSTLQSIHIGAGGYILSKDAAKKLYDHILTLDHLDHIDQYLFNTVLNKHLIPIHQLNPVLCIQDCILYPDHQKFSTHLQWREHVTTKNLTLMQKLVRELKRPFIQLKDQLQQTKLEFRP
ncbi:glycosyltransferase family 25 protein [Moraxella sp. Tifton1]|uniref:glycosyltransferase family 25 protein n=1 Tax=Moraxella oculi TaxID=2940516 RepID=UPI002010DBCC|nr:glycosyltransferase family 25 protein [Moraxella sp. Tifton1]MCL1622717.1 glycosyltransferase family 25 protein [Moraxella sp. Tifton1]